MLKDESQISRQARWQRKHRAMGLCVLCSRPIFKGWRCKKHYEQHKITMRLRYIPKVRGRYKVASDSGAGEAAAKTRKTSSVKKKSSSRTTAAASTKAASTRKTVAAKTSTLRETAAKTTASRTRKKTRSAAKPPVAGRKTAGKSGRS